VVKTTNLFWQCDYIFWWYRNTLNVNVLILPTVHFQTYTNSQIFLRMLTHVQGWHQAISLLPRGQVTRLQYIRHLLSYIIFDILCLTWLDGCGILKIALFGRSASVLAFSSCPAMSSRSLSTGSWKRKCVLCIYNLATSHCKQDPPNGDYTIVSACILPAQWLLPDRGPLSHMGGTLPWGQYALSVKNEGINMM